MKKSEKHMSLNVSRFSMTFSFAKMSWKAPKEKQ